MLSESPLSAPAFALAEPRTRSRTIVPKQHNIDRRMPGGRSSHFPGAATNTVRCLRQTPRSGDQPGLGSLKEYRLLGALRLYPPRCDGAGIIFWGGFNTELEVTNTEAFCIGCREMQKNVYQEIKSTIHHTNRSGVRTTCPDCHEPHKWTDKITCKIQASKEVWGTLFSNINTWEKFRDHRLSLAQQKWARLKSNDFLECRNCHDFIDMDITGQSKRAFTQHQKYLSSGEKTCINCHKGIPHSLSGMAGVKGWK